MLNFIDQAYFRKLTALMRRISVSQETKYFLAINKVDYYDTSVFFLRVPTCNMTVVIMPNTSVPQQAQHSQQPLSSSSSSYAIALLSITCWKKNQFTSDEKMKRIIN